MNSRSKKFVSYYKPYIGLFLADIACAFMVSAITLILPLCTRYIISIDGRRELIERLGLTGELALEDGQRVVYIILHVHRARKVLTLSPS